MQWFERRVSSILDSMWYFPCDTSLKIERAGASPGNIHFLLAAKTYDSQREPNVETSDVREEATACDLKGKICRFGAKTLPERLSFRIHAPSYESDRCGYLGGHFFIA